MEKKNGAQAIVDKLADSGVKRIYGLIGDSLNPIGEAVMKNGKIAWIPVRHEEAAAYAASAEALLTDELCVCAGTAGPGSVHLVNGLYEANRNNVPVLALVTDFYTSEQGLSYFQATHPEQLYKDCSIFCETLSATSQLPRLLQEAMQTAVSYKGVAVLIVPRDVSESEASDSPYDRRIEKTPAYLRPDSAKVQEMADILNSHEKITLYCGIGCKNAKDEVLYLADSLKAPTVCTFRSMDFMIPDNPYNAGMNGLISLKESKTAMENCEVLVLLGTDFPFRAFMPTKPITIQVDIAGKHLGRRSSLALGIVGDVGETLQMLLPLICKKDNDSYLQEVLAYKKEVDRKRDEELEEMANLPLLRPEYLTAMLSKVTEDDTIFAVDVGLNDVWACRYLDPAPARSIIGSFKHGTMAAAIPEAMGAKLAFPERQVIALSGDGGLTMLLGELLTIIQNQVDLKIVVYNNRELGFIRWEAERDGIKPYQIEMVNPDFALVAQAMGMKAKRIDSSENLENVLRQALNEPGPLLINAVTDPNALG